MSGWFSGMWALVGLTVREALRQRLWALFVAGMAALVIMSPSLKAAAAADRLKLSVVAQSSVVGFVMVLLAILIPAAALRRDLETRTAFMLFSKPLSRSAYLFGRWSGVQIVLLVGSILLCVIGTMTVAWQFGDIPSVRRVVSAHNWEQISAIGQVQPIADNRTRIQLDGAPGNGVRWHVVGLPESDRELEVLIKVRLRGYDADDEVSDLLVQVTAAPPGDASRVLVVDDASPYGHQRGNAVVPQGQAVVRDRDAGRVDLAADYLRLRLPASCIRDGSTDIVMTRLESRAMIIADRRESCLIAVAGHSFFINMVYGSFMQLAGAGLLAACALCVASVASMGVALLGGLTLFIGGAALPGIRETLEWGDTSAPMRRLLELFVAIFPDFSRFGAAPQLASGENISLSLVINTWLYASLYILPFLALSWCAVRRKEL